MTSGKGGPECRCSASKLQYPIFDYISGSNSTIDRTICRLLTVKSLMFPLVFAYQYAQPSFPRVLVGMSAFDKVH